MDVRPPLIGSQFPGLRKQEKQRPRLRALPFLILLKFDYRIDKQTSSS